MPKTNRICCPADLGCDFTSCRGIESACIHCGLGICAGCDARLDPSELAEVRFVPGEHAPGGLCAVCLAEGEEDSDGVPQPVEEEETVKETTLTDAQMLALLDTMVECRSAA